ncbi:MAG: type II/IV secretion system protein, partial [Magnetococcales bacterium]|nr:type II/IV secretion system protein [Magnetococcales bacterium]
SLHKKYAAMITVRIKVISGMNITESRAPQDGRFTLQLFGMPVDFRVSSMAVTHGENVVLRILDRSKGILSLDELELSDQAMLTMKLLMARPEGIILVTGPTGSGKTTTLYSMLDWLNKESVNIMTLEDPVEYPLPMVRQANVNPDANMGFAQGIRTLMRQDPDIILVGEVRDEETAEMAFRAAMTGHQVFSTVHANSAIRAITRLKDIGVTREVMVGNLIGIIAQRLVRRLCSYCREAYHPNETERRLLGLETSNQNTTIYKPKGCPYCDHQGYKGRRSILEVLMVDREIEGLIDQNANHDTMQRAMEQKGFWTLADDGARNVLEGHTSLEEITRVVDLTERIH